MALNQPQKFARVTTVSTWCAVVGGLFGLIGFLARSAFWEQVDSASTVQAVLDAVYSTAQLFILEGDLSAAAAGPITDWTGWLLQAARFMAPAGLVGVIVSTLAGLIAPLFRHWRAANWKRHVIIWSGNGPMGGHFAADALDQGRRVVLLDPARSLAISTPSQAESGKLVVQPYDPKRSEAWVRSGCRRASDVIICSPSDADNLTVANAVREAVSAGGRVSGDGQPLRLHIHVGDEPLRRQFAGRSGGPGETIDQRCFSVHELAARQFFETHDLFREALLARSPQFHLLLIGFDKFNAALMLEFLRISPCSGLAVPIVTIVTENPVRTRSKLETAIPEIDQIARLHHIRCALDGGSINEALLTAIEQPDSGLPGVTAMPVTAVSVSTGATENNLSIALALQQFAQRHNRCRAPIFLRHIDGEPTPGLTVNFGVARSSADVVEAIGSYRQICRLDQIAGARDIQARQFHAAYLRKKGISADTPEYQRQGADWEWPQLGETYRLANRRAADHARTKLISLGYRVKAGVLTRAEDQLLSPSAAERERVSELEHQSWMIDRQIDGWRHGKLRDDSMRLHPDIVGWDALSEATRDFDRDQVDQLMTEIIRPAAQPTVAKELRVGMIGHNRLTAAEAERLDRALQETILPNLARAHPDKHLTFLTPLAPGADLVTAEALLAIFAERHENWELRIIQTLPVAHLVEKFLEGWQPGNVWSVSDLQTAALSRDEARQRIGAALARISAGDGVRTRIVNLQPVGAGPDHWVEDENFTQAFQTGAAYMAEMCDILVAFLDPARPGGAGGTKETVDAFRSRGIGDAVIVS